MLWKRKYKAKKPDLSDIRWCAECGTVFISRGYLSKHYEETGHRTQNDLVRIAVNEGIQQVFDNAAKSPRRQYWKDITGGTEHEKD